jgi:hypothetical protein
VQKREYYGPDDDKEQSSQEYHEVHDDEEESSPSLPINLVPTIGGPLEHSSADLVPVNNDAQEYYAFKSTSVHSPPSSPSFSSSIDS